jgi:hypothetical protein
MTDDQGSWSRRTLLQSLLGIFSASLLASCGDSSASNFTLPGQLQSTAAPAGVSINRAEIGGNPLLIFSGRQGSLPFSGQSVNIDVSSVGAQALFALDEAGSVRGVALSVPQNGVPQPVTIDNASTAIGILMLIPGMLETNPSLAPKRMADLQALPGFPALLALLAQNLPTTSLNALMQGNRLFPLIETLSQQWTAVVNPPLLFKGAATGDIDAQRIPPTQEDIRGVQLVNSGWRYVSVVLQELGANDAHINAFPVHLQKSTNVTEVINLLPGVSGASWGTLFTLQIGGTSTAVDNVSYPGNGQVKKLRYWIKGPGFAGISFTPNLPPQVPETLFGTDPWAISFLIYLVMPACEVILGLTSLVAAILGNLNEVDDVITKPFLVQDAAELAASHTLENDAMRAAIRSGNKDEMKVAGTSLLTAYFGAGLTILGEFLGSTAGAAVVGAVGTGLTAASTLMGLYNFVHAVDYWYSAAPISSVDVPIEGSTEPLTFHTVATSLVNVGYPIALNPIGDVAYGTEKTDGTVSLRLKRRLANAVYPITQGHDIANFEFTADCLNSNQDLAYTVETHGDLGVLFKTYLARFKTPLSFGSENQGPTIVKLEPPPGFSVADRINILHPKSVLNRRQPAGSTFDFNATGPTFVFGILDRIVGTSTLEKNLLWVHDGTQSAAVDFGTKHPFVGDNVFLHDLRVNEEGMVAALASFNDFNGPRTIFRWQYPLVGTATSDEIIIVRENVVGQEIDLNFLDAVVYRDTSSQQGSLRVRAAGGVTDNLKTPPAAVHLVRDVALSPGGQTLSIGVQVGDETIEGDNQVPIFWDLTGPGQSLYDNLPDKGKGLADLVLTNRIAMSGRFVAAQYVVKTKRQRLLNQAGTNNPGNVLVAHERTEQTVVAIAEY